MILVVADSGPVNYLIQIGHIDILPRLADKVVVPAAVQTELTHDEAPREVRAWAANPPAWVEVQSATQQIEERDISSTDREAIALAIELGARFLLMDDRQARACATRRGVATIGTLGLLEAASARGLLSLPTTLAKLRSTSCYLSDELAENALQRDRERQKQSRPT
jgi:predicted nucleic acid-binding protein